MYTTEGGVPRVGLQNHQILYAAARIYEQVFLYLFFSSQRRCQTTCRRAAKDTDEVFSIRHSARKGTCRTRVPWQRVQIASKKNVFSLIFSTRNFSFLFSVFFLHRFRARVCWRAEKRTKNTMFGKDFNARLLYITVCVSVCKYAVNVTCTMQTCAWNVSMCRNYNNKPLLL